VDIRGKGGILHLKSGLSYLGEGRVAVIAALAEHPALSRYERILVPEGEEYAANCVRVNGAVLVADGYPAFQALLRGLGHELRILDVSEFRKMDGGLSCLSLRF
jgi:dimethylargininase